MDRRRNLFGLKREELEALVTEMGLPVYRARQIYRGMYARGATDLQDMTDLPRSLRTELGRQVVIRHPEPAGGQASRDGTQKYLFGFEDGKSVEAVYIPEPGDATTAARATLCLSTQVGCPLACTFCYSGRMAFARNLSTGEILGQFLGVKKQLESAPARINVVYMGMGEPLLNRRAVLDSLEVLTDPNGFGVSPRRVTVSTAGLARELESFVREAPSVGLAVSLHATRNGLRDRLMPINRRYPLAELLEAIRNLPLPRRRKVTFEYVLLGGENDSEQDARELSCLLRGVKAKVNLIAFNPWPGAPHRPSSPEAAERFMEVLARQGYTVSLRRSRGADVLAACGQLAGQAPTLA